MNVAIAMTSTGTTEPTTLPVGVSPIVRATSPPTAAAMAPATTKIRIAATTFGRYAPIDGDEVVERGDPELGDGDRQRAEEEEPEGDRADQLEGLCRARPC